MKISQREARALKRRVLQLEQIEERRRAVWSREYPGGTHIASEPNSNHYARAAIATARKLGHAVVAIERDTEIAFYALPLAKLP